MSYLLTRSGDLHKDSYTGVLPAWNLEEFLVALQDLPTRTFHWAMQHCEDELLADLLDCQLEKEDDVTIRKFITYQSTRGPLITISIKKRRILICSASVCSSRSWTCVRRTKMDVRPS